MPGTLNLPPETPLQKQVKRLIDCRADSSGRKLGMHRRSFLSTACGVATTFLAINEVYGPLFNVAPAGAVEPDLHFDRHQGLAEQFILDDKVQFLPARLDKDNAEYILKGALYFANKIPAMQADLQKLGSAFFEFENFLTQIFLNSDTKAGLLSSIVSRNGQ